MNSTIRVSVCLLAFACGAAPARAQQHPMEDVVRNLRNPDPKVRQTSVRLLRESRHLDAITPMAPLVVDPVNEVQLEAIGAELSFYLVEDIPARRRVAFLIEVRRGQGTAEAAFDQGPFAAWPRPVPAELTKALLDAIDDDHARVRHEAIYTLGVIGRAPLEPAHAEQLVKALDHYDPSIRAAAARVAGRLQVASAADALIKSINDSAREVRYAAMRALGDLHEERAVPALAEQLTYYGKGEGAYSALGALAVIAHPSSVPIFEARLADKDPWLRRAAAEGLGRTRHTAAIPALELAAGNDEAEMVRTAASFALQRMGKNYVGRIVESLDGGDSAAQAGGYCLELGPSIVSELTPHLQDPDPGIRANVAIVIGALNGDVAIAALRPLLQDRDKSVVQAATRALERIRMTQ